MANETFEVWVRKVRDEKSSIWLQVEEKGNGGIFAHRNRAMLIGEAKSHEPDVVETVVISRRPIAEFNGEAVFMKHRLPAVEAEEPKSKVEKKKEENVDVHEQPEVHGSRSEEGVPQAPDPGHGGKADG